MTTPLHLAAVALAGAFTWTLLEYVLHRFAGHEARGRIDFSREHLKHHAVRGYFTPLPKKLRTAVLVLGTTGVVTGALAGAPLGLSFTLGLSAMYATYEVLHWRLHVAGPRGPYGRWARRHHFHHHFRCPGGNHGVTSPLWDLVFGTWNRPPAVIRVPQRHVLPWLIDPATGDVRPTYAREWAISSQALRPPRAS